MQRREFIIAAGASLFALPTLADARPTIALAPYKGLTKNDIEIVRNIFTHFFDAQILVMKRVPLPSAAYYKPRKRYRADKLLEDLRARVPHEATRIVGLTHRDISTTKGPHKDWGIFGLGEIGGPSCVVSRHRLRRATRQKQNERLAKVALHELGHTLSLNHCPNRGCFMEDGAGTVKTVDREIDFCGTCKKTLNQGAIRLTQRESPFAS